MQKADIKAGIFMIFFGGLVLWYSSRYAKVVINIYGPNFYRCLRRYSHCKCNEGKGSGKERKD